MKLPTASQLDRAKRCPASCVLPQTENVSEWNERGGATHTYLLSESRGKAHHVPPDHRAYVERIKEEEVPRGIYEISFAMDLESGLARVLGRNLPDYKGAHPQEVCGTADIFKSEGAYVYIGDVKTGLAHHVPPPQENLQLGFLALAASRVENKDKALVEILHIMETGDVKKEGVFLDGWKLDAIEVELVHTIGRVREAAAIVAAAGVPPVVTGPHCKFCPAFAACPAQTALVKLMAAGGRDLEKQIMEALTVETAGRAYAMYKNAQELLNRVRDGIYGFAQQHPVDIGNGWELKEVELRRQKISGAKTYKWLMTTMGPDVAEDATEVTATKASVKRAFAKHVPKGGRLEMERALMAALEKDEGITTTVSKAVKPVKSGKGNEEDDES